MISNNSVYIMGNRGNMAKRYAAVLDYLGVSYSGHDLGDTVSESEIKRHTHILICTPTENHLEDLENFGRFQKPMLCEKPFTKEIDLLWKFEKKNKAILPLISMVNQYAQLTNVNDPGGPTVYNYFKSGGDGIAWDCINIIGLSRGTVEVLTTSPFWHCSINGKKLKLSDMDYAYIDMIIDWLRVSKGNWEYARIAHAKVVNYLEEGL